MCATLAWYEKKYISNESINKNNNNINDKIRKKKTLPKIIFTSRTHSQLQQFISEYKKTKYCKHFQMIVLGSRKSLCINEQFKYSSDINQQWYVFILYSNCLLTY